MNLSLHDIGELPLAAALLEPGGAPVRTTPEWTGPGQGCRTYRVRAHSLVVSPGAAGADVGPLAARLLDTLDEATRAASGTHALQLQLLAAALRLVFGRPSPRRGSTDEVLHLARAGIRARTQLEVSIEDAEPVAAVEGVEAAALALVQLAANAERHAGVSAVTLRRSGLVFSVEWRGSIAQPAPRTARGRRDRARWGLGFARAAADAVGGAVFAPHQAAAGRCEATLELGLQSSHSPWPRWSTGESGLPLVPGMRRRACSRVRPQWNHPDCIS